MSNVSTITFPAPGRTTDRRLVAIWSVSSTLPHTRDAWKLIDPETLTSATGLVRALHQRLTGIHAEIDADKNLSPTGKQAAKTTRTAGIGKGLLGHLASHAGAFRDLEAAHRAAVNAATPKIPEPTASDTLIDLALATKIAAGDIPPSLLAGKLTERGKQAMLRLPIELSGITAESQEAIRGSMIDPAAALRLEETAEALSAARKVLQQAVNEIAPYAGGTTAEKRAEIGPGFTVPE